jgi:PAS domain S-box-containing protein
VNSRIRVLILEDNASDFELMKRELRSAGFDYTVEWAQDKKTFLQALDKFIPNLLLLDYSLPGFDGLSALALSQQRFPDIPVIIVSGAIGEEVAIETLKAGATDYVLKQRLTRLGFVIQRALQEAEQRTERKRAEDALRQSEERFRLLVDGVKDYAIFMVDPEGYVTSWNAGAERIKGWTAEEILGKHISCFYLPEAVASGQPERALELASQTGQFEEEGYRVRKDCEVFWANTLITAIHNEVGQLRGFAKVTRDITERKLMEMELRKARDELERRVRERTVELSQAKEELEIINEELQSEITQHEQLETELVKTKESAEAAAEAKAAFLANMSHELRTPMNAVIGYSSLLLDDSLTSEQRDFVEGIRKGGEALLSIINDILDFSRAEKDKIELEHQPLSLKRCIDESLDIVALQAEQKGLNLVYTVSYGTPDTIFGDPGRIRQILVNLLSNAVKFTDKGVVSVSVSSKALEGNTHQITFAVEDTGIGMPRDKMDRLFQPFTQLEYVISRKRDGAGLGLAICKELVELMGGEIRAESEVGKGSILSFTFRAETVPGKQLDLDEKDRPAVYETLSVQKPMAILVAEDNPSNQKVLVRMLKRMGYRPDAVADGKEVIQALELRPYDLIFMDVKMPEMDGITATKVIRRLLPTSGPKIIAITAYALEGDREMCLEAGMDDYISKPVQEKQLAAILTKYSIPSRDTA